MYFLKIILEELKIRKDIPIYYASVIHFRLTLWALTSCSRDYTVVTSSSNKLPFCFQGHFETIGMRLLDAQKSSWNADHTASLSKSQMH